MVGFDEIFDDGIELINTHVASTGERQLVSRTQSTVLFLASAMAHGLFLIITMLTAIQFTLHKRWVFYN